MKTNIAEQLVWYKENIKQNSLIPAKSYTIYSSLNSDPKKRPLEQDPSPPSIYPRTSNSLDHDTNNNHLPLNSKRPKQTTYNDSNYAIDPVPSTTFEQPTSLGQVAVPFDDLSNLEYDDDFGPEDSMLDNGFMLDNHFDDDMDLDTNTTNTSLREQLADLERKQSEIGVKVFRTTDPETMSSLVSEGQALTKAIDDLKRMIDLEGGRSDVKERTNSSPYFLSRSSATPTTTPAYSSPGTPSCNTTTTPSSSTNMRTDQVPPLPSTALCPQTPVYHPPATSLCNITTTPSSSTNMRIDQVQPLPSTASCTQTTVYHPPATEDNYPWSKDVRRVLTQVFNLTDFRRHQLEAINTTLNGEDVFVLMPTGGGKSLCYQLPATMQQGKYGDKECRIGVTVVVSPLLSLMQDQVEHLKQRGIPAELLGSHVGLENRRAVYAGLAGRNPHLQLVYVTPEMIQRSDAFQNTLQRLFECNRLARFVIDEAHCVSQWGHDFRPDYKLLGNLKTIYPGIPIIALTATANQRVQHDLMVNLNILGCKVFKQSFNRSNLKYEIVHNCTKHVDRLDDINQFISTRYRNKCGIIYCVSKKLCEDVASKLRDTFRIRTAHYHAGMTQEERTEAQQKWQNDEYQVIVATIAFGMGIDKPNVRFVIHYSIPSSVEGYYQETGRAGRDGLEATCRLYYSYADSRTHRALIDSGEGGYDQKKCQLDNLNSMMQYCENTVDCRRKQVLAYFGEVFDPAQCLAPVCDNCIKNRGKLAFDKDVTMEARCMLKLLQDVGRNMGTSGGYGHENDKITLIQLVDTFRGLKKKAFVEKGYTLSEQFGKGSHLTKHDATRLAQHLLSLDYLLIYTEANYKGFNNTYITLGEKAHRLLSGEDTVFMREVVENKATPRSNASASSSSTRPTPRLPYPRSHQTNPLPPQRFLPTQTVTPSGRSLPSTLQSLVPRTTAPIAPAPIPAGILKIQTDCYHEMVNLRNELKARNKLAKPSTIFTDNELKVMATQLPAVIRTFMELTGIDDNKYERYGTHFLKITKKYAEKQASETDQVDR